MGQLFSEYNRMASALLSLEEEDAAALRPDAGEQSDDSGEEPGAEVTRTHSYDPTRVVARQKVNWSPTSVDTEPDLLADEPTMIIKPNKED